MSLEELRRRIDEIDRQILRLLNERARLAGEVGEEKRKSGEDAYAPDRERQILEAIQEANSGPLDKAAVKSIFGEIISACRQLQARLRPTAPAKNFSGEIIPASRSPESTTRVAFLGPLGTFSHLAARNCFGSGAEFLPLPTFRDVVLETEKGNADYGILPVENSTDGPLGETLDLLAETRLSICGERYVPVHHCLLSPSVSRLDQIKKVYSLPIVFRQCQGWLNSKLPRAQFVDTYSTSQAAENAKKEPGSSAIATWLSAQIYGLEVVAENIEDLPHNRTRFVLLSSRPPEPSGKDKTSLLFSTKHEPGALHRALGAFERAQLNLTMIQSRPDRRTPWEYLFFLDFTGHQADEKVKQALAELKNVTTYIKILGSYPEGE